MSTQRSKTGFVSGLKYLLHQQNNGTSHEQMSMLNRRFEFSKNLYSKDLFSHYGCVNAVEFSKDGNWLASGGDDKRVLLWNIDKTLSGSYQPKAMKAEHNSNIFCLGFNSSQTKLFSAGNDEQVILHDLTTGEVLDVFIHDEAVYGLSVDPLNESIFASACDNGRILIWDARLASNEPFTIAQCNTAYHAVMYNPVEPRFLASANAKEGVCLWDIRKPKEKFLKYGSSVLTQGAMNVRFNSNGTHLLALRRRFPPVLFEVTSSAPVAEFDHQEYYNSCTMKSCCFAGDNDQYVVSGSDDFKLYIWKIPDSFQTKKDKWISKAHLILRGHRSIVNQVRYNKTYGLLVSSGVEKVIKLWSSFPLTYQDSYENYVSSTDSLRKVYSHEEYVNFVLQSGQFMSHDYSHHSVQEDPRMMAFFDSLVQRDIEGWTSDSSNANEMTNTCFVVQPSNSSSSSSSSSSSDEELREARAANRLQRIFNTSGPSSTAHSPMSLTYITKQSLANNIQSGNSNAEEETRDPLLDRISILIAQKRKEQMLKVSRSSMHLNKSEHKRSSDVLTSSEGSSKGNQQVKRQSSFLAAADKRKLLRRKRAKLNRNPSLEHGSSDSDESNSRLLNDKSISENSIVSSDSVTENLSDATSKKKCNIANRHFNRGISNGASSVNKLDQDCIKEPNTVQNDVNVDVLNSVNNIRDITEKPICDSKNATEETVTTSVSTSSISLNNSGGKKNRRNYRKRSGNDLDDD